MLKNGKRPKRLTFNEWCDTNQDLIDSMYEGCDVCDDGHLCDYCESDLRDSYITTCQAENIRMGVDPHDNIKILSDDAGSVVTDG